MLVNDVRRLFVGFSVQRCPEAQVTVNVLAVASRFPHYKAVFFFFFLLLGDIFKVLLAVVLYEQFIILLGY